MRDAVKYAHDLVIGIGRLSGAVVIWELQINQGLIRFVHPELKFTEDENDVFTDMMIERINA